MLSVFFCFSILETAPSLHAPRMDSNYLYCPQGYINISCLLFLKTTRYKNTKKYAARRSSCNPFILTAQQLAPITKALVLQAFYIWSQEILNLQLEFVSCFFPQNLPVSMNVVGNCVNCWYKKGKPVTNNQHLRYYQGFWVERFLWNFPEINWT